MTVIPTRFFIPSIKKGRWGWEWRLFVSWPNIFLFNNEVDAKWDTVIQLIKTNLYLKYMMLGNEKCSLFWSTYNLPASDKITMMYEEMRVICIIVSANEFMWHQLMIWCLYIIVSSIRVYGIDHRFDVYIWSLVLWVMSLTFVNLN